MQIHNLKPSAKKKSKKRVGRGGKRGAYSGRGMKGQKSRAGRKMRPELRDIIKKIPKKRGYRFNPRKEKPAIVSLKELEKKFEDGAKINPKTLIESGLIQKKKGKIPVVKLLASGQFSKKLLVSQCQFSQSAKEKIEKAGGQIKE
ncbi:MAG: 50S ribosomal protein L15 [Patescibacteria group bacterium]